MPFSGNDATSSEAPLYVALAMLYFLANGLMLVVGDAQFWDGHPLLEFYRRGVLNQHFSDIGYTGYAWIHTAYLQFSVFWGRLAVFLCHLFAGLLIFRTSKYQPVLGTEHRFFVSALFLVLPFNFAKISIINLPYAICVLSFFIGWLLWCRYEVTKHSWYRFVSIILFFLSFFTQSLLVFFVWPFLFCWGISKTGLIAFAIKRIEFTLAPVAFFLLYRIFVNPSSEYVSYNAISIGEALLTGPVSIVWSAFVFLDTNFLVLLGSLVLVLILERFLVSGALRPEGSHFRSSSLYILLGLLATASAIAPYLLVGKFPLYQGWSSRHQLLMPLGIAITFLGFSLFCNASGRKAARIGLLAACVATSSTGYWRYVVDVLKQDAFVAAVRSNEDARTARTFAVVDHAWFLNAFNRQYNLAEYSALMNRAFDDDIIRLALDRNYGQHQNRTDSAIASVIEAGRTGYLRSENSYTGGSIDCALLIETGPVEMSLRDQLTLTFLRLSRSPDYQPRISQILRTSCEPVY